MNIKHWKIGTRLGGAFGLLLVLLAACIWFGIASLRLLNDGTSNIVDEDYPKTILAYEMNGQPLPILHGAPLRLRVETQLGFTMVKYIRAIEFIDNYKSIGQGQGGWREDYQYFSQEAGI